MFANMDRNVLARLALGLPLEPRLPKPKFRDVEIGLCGCKSCAKLKPQKRPKIFRRVPIDDARSDKDIRREMAEIEARRKS